MAFLRYPSGRRDHPLAVLCNFSPVHRKNYRLGVPVPGSWQVILNSDDTRFGGSGLGDAEALSSQSVPCHGLEQSVQVDLPPMRSLILRKLPENDQEVML